MCGSQEGVWFDYIVVSEQEEGGTSIDDDIRLMCNREKKVGGLGPPSIPPRPGHLSQTKTMFTPELKLAVTAA